MIMLEAAEKTMKDQEMVIQNLQTQIDELAKGNNVNISFLSSTNSQSMMIYFFLCKFM